MKVDLVEMEWIIHVKGEDEKKRNYFKLDKLDVVEGVRLGVTLYDGEDYAKVLRFRRTSNERVISEEDLEKENKFFKNFPQNTLSS